MDPELRADLAELFEFLFARKDDDRLSIHKEIKYGHKNYWMTFDIDVEPNHSVKSGNNSWNMIGGSLRIHFDSRNSCISVHSDDHDNLIFEDRDLLEEWCAKLEAHISAGLRSGLKAMADSTFATCWRKDVHREWTMRKILPDEDESI